MPRPKRIHYEGAVYHVTSRGNERRKIFLSDEERWLFLRILEEMIEHHGAVCHAWVLMDNHYHLLLETPEANLSFAMKHLNAIYTQKFNKKHHRSGHLFQGRFKAIVVEKDSYLKELCRYVVLNPVRAKMVKHPKDWKWSSYRGTAGQDKLEKWMETDWLLGQFGKNKKQAQAAYKKFVEEGIGQKGSPWDDLHFRAYLGTKEFLGKVHETGKKHKYLDVPKYQKDVVRRSPEEVLKVIGKVYGVKADEILKSGKRGFDARDAAIYLLKKESKLSLKELGRRMGVGFSAVGNQWTRIKKRMETDEVFGEKVLNCKM
jgi:REP element-mobilizing transposase RayT